MGRSRWMTSARFLTILAASLACAAPATAAIGTPASSPPAIAPAKAAAGQAFDPVGFYPQFWLQAASGGQTTCGISTDQVGWCWGDSEEGQVGLGLHGHSASISAPNQPLDKGNTLWSQMAVGTMHSCGIHTDHSMWCWGDDTVGQLGDGGSALQDKPVAVTGGASQWFAVSAGASHTCALGTDHSLWCWGANQAGQLGIGSTQSSNVPRQVTGTTWTSVSAGGDHTCATRSDQSLWCWGTNAHGELGLGPKVGNQTAPVEVTKKSWSAVASGMSHTCALSPTKKGGLLWCWGDTGVSNAPKPKKVDKSVKTWVSISAGDDETCGVRADKQTYCWGTNAYGQLGLGDTTTRNQPTQITFRLGWSVAIAGGTSTCAIRSDTTLWCWGYNSFGQLGDHAREPRYLPTTVNDSTRWLAVSDSGGQHSCAISDVLHFNNFLYCWGVNDHGQLGDGTTTTEIFPEYLPGATWTDVTGGESYTCAIRTDGSLWCWGANEHGQLGVGTQQETHVPVQVTTPQTTWLQVSAGDDHTCAVAANSSLWCWGNNSNGQLGNGSTVNTSVPVQVGASTDWTHVSGSATHTCGLRSDKSVWCWGDNSHGQLGDGSQTQRLSPVEVASDPKNWTQVDVGGMNSCAIDAQQMLYCWGIDDHGQAGLGGGADVLTPTHLVGQSWYNVSVAKDHSCGSTPPDSSPELFCWGVARDGDLGDGQTSGEEDVPIRMLYQKGDPWYYVYTYDDRTCGEKAWTECFGNNDVGQLGDGSPAPYRLMPTTVFVIPD